MDSCVVAPPMKVVFPFFAAFILVAFSSMAQTADVDARTLVKLPAPMQQHMLANMRDHLRAIGEIQDALGMGAYDKAANIAETRIGVSSLDSHGASHMAPYMPKAMQDIGTGMHKAASQFARTAEKAAVTGDMRQSITALAKVTQQCVACHAAFRTH